MDLTAFFALAATGLSVAFIHAAIPTHWLPFVVVARAQGWIVLGTDSDVYARVDANANVQRNPNRSADTGED